MAVAAAAALLDELMGRSRNEVGAVTEKPVRWDDPEYCKYYMVQFCPHELFVNTKADLGPCQKIHCDEAKAQFEALDDALKVQYEDDFLKLAQQMLNDVERKITKGEQRLALMIKEPKQQIPPQQSQKNEEKIAFLSEKIAELVKEAEQMGINGNVEQAQSIMKLCDEFKEEREALRRQTEAGSWPATVEIAVAQEKQMEVCKVCGAFLIVGDAQSRIDDHLQGKQHTGYGRLKFAVEEITKKREEERSKKERKREEESAKRSIERERRVSEKRSDRSRSPRSSDKRDRNERTTNKDRNYNRGRDGGYGSFNRNRLGDHDRGRAGVRDFRGRGDMNYNKDKWDRRERERNRDYRSHSSRNFDNYNDKGRSKVNRDYSERNKRIKDEDVKREKGYDKHSNKIGDKRDKIEEKREISHHGDKKRR